MNVLSLFDGMSCGQQALERASIKVDNYYASEIDKHAISITQKNYPNTIQLGSVVNVDVHTLDKIDLLIGGSPCQSFSFAGKRKGMSTKDEIEILSMDQYLELKEQNFEFEGQSYLFWEYMRILTDLRKINPDIKFLLENVMMGEKWEKVLSRAIGVNPIEINSSLVSAQNRRRLYWTNIGMQPAGLFGDLESVIVQPKDKGILLKDILQTEVNEKYFLSDKMIKWLDRHSEKRGNEFKKTTGNRKAGCLSVSALCCQNLSADFIVHSLMPRSSTSRIIQHIIPEIVSVRKYDVDILGLQKILKEHKKINNQQIANHLNIPKTMVDHWFRTDNYFSIPDKDIWMKLKELLQINTNEFDESIMTFEEKESVFDKTNRVYDEDGIAPTLTSTSADERILVREIRQLNTSRESGDIQPYQQNRIYDVDGITPALCANKSDLIINTARIRRLTPTECERLQTVQDGYTEGVSDTQRYRMLGNGWTVEVIAHIFNYLNN